MSLGFGLWNRLNFTDFRGIMFHYKRARLKRLCPDQNYRNQKGDRIMKKIAVTYENGNVFPHFGHTEQFKVYDIESGNVTGAQIVDTDGNGHGALAGMLSALQVDTLICGGIGAGAQTALAEAGIRLYGGVSGSADEAVSQLLAGTLVFQPDVHCDHHGEGHSHEGGHHCGTDKHGCGGNGGGCR